MVSFIEASDSRIEPLHTCEYKNCQHLNIDDQVKAKLFPDFLKRRRYKLFTIHEINRKKLIVGE